MKYNITRIVASVAIVLILATLASCRKGGINGDLDGQWRVLTVEDLSTGTVTEPTNIFYCFYLHTVNLSNPGVAATGIMTYSGTSLTLEFPYFPANYTEGTLSSWGIYTTETNFKIERLNSNHLTIASTRSRITMRKF